MYICVCWFTYTHNNECTVRIIPGWSWTFSAEPTSTMHERGLNFPQIGGDNHWWTDTVPAPKDVHYVIWQVWTMDLGHFSLGQNKELWNDRSLGSIFVAYRRGISIPYEWRFEWTIVSMGNFSARVGWQPAPCGETSQSENGNSKFQSQLNQFQTILCWNPQLLG